MTTIREKKHRLPDVFYEGCCSVAFTACVLFRRRAFVSELMFNEVETRLIESCVQHRCSADVYLFMPDHGHIIITAEADGNAASAMKLFKQRTGFWFSQMRMPFRWQKDFFDHVIRGEVEYQRQVKYILNNPVEAGLAVHWREYPYKGSMRWDLSTWDGLL